MQPKVMLIINKDLDNTPGPDPTVRVFEGGFNFLAEPYSPKHNICIVRVLHLRLTMTESVEIGYLQGSNLQIFLNTVKFKKHVISDYKKYHTKNIHTPLSILAILSCYKH